MRDSHYRITLDITKTQSQVSLPVKKGDTSRKIYISLVEGSQPYEIDGTKCTAVFHGIKSDGTKLENFCIIEGNTIRYDFTEQTTAAPGLMECDITLHHIETGVIASSHFSIIVDDRVIEPPILSEDQSITFDEVLTVLGDVRNAEAARILNEKDRVGAETERVSNEQTRIANEEDRNANEETRKKAAQSLANLNNRVTTAENERVSAEEARQTAEDNRQAMWNNCIENPKVWELNPGCYYVSGMVSISSYVSFPVYDNTILYIAPDDADGIKKRFVVFLGYAYGMPFDVLTGTTDGETEEFYIVETNKNKTTEINENSTHEEYPSAKATYDALLAQAIDIKVEPFDGIIIEEEWVEEETPLYGEEPVAYTMSRSTTGVTATNYITNGNFESADGWVAGSGNTLKVADNKASLTFSVGATGRLTQSINKDVAPQRAGDIWFLKLHITPDIAEPMPVATTMPLFSLGLNTDDGVKSTQFKGYKNETDIYTTVTLSATANVNMTFLPSVTYGSGDTLERTCYFSKAVLVNLTEVYGGDVPEDAADEFYKLLSTLEDAYFDGTTTLYEDTGDSGESGGDTPGGDTGGDDNTGGDDSGDSGNENPGGSTDVVSDSGYKLTITTAEKTETLYLYQGQPGNDGKDGANGKDGFSPTIEVEEIEGGNRLNITDKNGSKSVDIMNGEQGGSNTDAEVTNLVSNGNFVDSTGWSILKAQNANKEVVECNDLTVSNNTVILKGNGNTQYIGMTSQLYSSEGFTEHKLFTKVNAELEKHTNVANQYVLPQLQIYNNSPVMSYAYNGFGNEVEQDYYGTMTANIAAGKSIGITWRANYNNASFSSGKTCKFKNALVVDLTEVFGAGNEPSADEFYALLNALDNKWFDGTINLLDTSLQIKRISDEQIVDKDIVVTVGAGGDFATINKAMQYLSHYYPAYKRGGINCEIQILDGTVIDEQIIVERADFSYISITSANANNTVIVTPTAPNWNKGTVTHDTRGNIPFFGGEFGARLPVIKCLFKLETENGDNTVTIEGTKYPVVGYYCNRGSMGVVAGHVDTNGARDIIGFDGFYDNIIANNNSEIVVREAIARNAGRYGIMSRHISRVSARSADITNCGTVIKEKVKNNETVTAVEKEECAAAYADRSSMMDVRKADLSGSFNGLQCFNTSNMTAVETIANNITNIVADSREGSVVNCVGMPIDKAKDVFQVLNGGTLVAKGAKITNATGKTYNTTTINTLDANGVIYE